MAVYHNEKQIVHIGIWMKPLPGCYVLIYGF